MSLSKQLYIIISIIFLMIFTGNFVISVKNTKEYLEAESITKAQDTATSLGMSLKNLLSNKKNPEIESIINAIANSGFYKEIRLENSLFTITQEDVIDSVMDSDIEANWTLSNFSVPKEYGRLEKMASDLEINNQLLALEDEKTENILPETIENNYTFIPNEKYKKGGTIPVSFIAINDKGIKIDQTVNFEFDKVLVQVTRPEKFDSVPAWFINLISFNLQEQSSEINDGWQTTAIIFVSANAGEAYAKLFEQVKGTLIYSAIALLISMLILFIFVQYLLKPLKNLEKLANDIAIGKFGKILELPWTTEIKNVAIAFNDMSTKIEAIINKLNNKLIDFTKKLSQDELTQLPLKQSFETDIKNMFIHKSTGYILVVKIFDLSSFAKSHTTIEVNNFIQRFANILKSTKVTPKDNISVYRFLGSEFALIAREYDEEKVKKLIKLLQNEFNNLSFEYNKKDIAHIGATPFNQFSTSIEILQKANEAYEKATLIGSNEAFINDSSELSRDMESWRNLVFDIIDNSKFDVRYIGDCYTFKEDSSIVLQEAFTSIKDEEDNDLAIGTFVSIAEKYEKVVDFDKKVILKVINHILINNVKHDIAINLSLESINNTAFIAWLEKKIIEHKTISKQLVFSVTAYAVAKNIEKFKFFVDEMHQCNAKIIIKRFESKFIPLENLKDLNLDYIRLARDYTCNICNDSSKQHFVESIQELSTLLNIKVLAENVKSDDDLQNLKDLGLFGASR